MKYAVVGGDVRFAHLARMLAEGGRDAQGFLQQGTNQDVAQLADYDCVLSRWPMDRCDEVMRAIPSGTTLLLCGPKFPEERRSDLRYVNLWSDQRLLEENAYLTAEAAVAFELARWRTLAKTRCLVIGFGRIGSALTEILTDLRAEVTVSTQSADKLSRIHEIGARGVLQVALPDVLPEIDLIFSTPPGMVLDEGLLALTKPDVEIVDLASPPYGVDLEAAERLHRSARREPNLPGRYCPVSAAQVLLHAVERWEASENG